MRIIVMIVIIMKKGFDNKNSTNKLEVNNIYNLTKKKFQ